MKNQLTGMYEYSKFWPSTGMTIVGVGETQEEAKADFKAKREKYKAQPLVPTGEYVPSPGFVGVRLDDGRVRYQFKAERTAQVLTRPGLTGVNKKQDEDGASGTS
jgi:hypothetical protein